MKNSRITNSLVVFGDLHLDWRALEVILNEARKLGINTALNLGDEGCFFGGNDEDYEKLYKTLREFRDERAERELICVVGGETGGVPRDLFRNYLGVDSEGKTSKNFVFKIGNVIVGHWGEKILKRYKKLILSYNGLEPLVIFHGHSHSMGVLPEFKWLKDEEFVFYLPEGERDYLLEQGKVYWVNPGAQERSKERFANFALYYPQEQRIILRTVQYT